MVPDLKNKFSHWWYYSKFRFHLLNAVWNYQFWLNAKKIYTETEYKPMNDNGFYTGEIRKIKKFLGYKYKDKVYLDNPGMPINDRSLWKHWKEKGLIR